jgi:hypothetical protein
MEANQRALERLIRAHHPAVFISTDDEAYAI